MNADFHDYFRECSGFKRLMDVIGPCKDGKWFKQEQFELKESERWGMI